MNKQGTYNCGVCDKCLRTMVNLSIAGVLKQAKTFPGELNLELIAATPPDKSEDGDIFHAENLEALEANNSWPELQAALRHSLEQYTTPTASFTTTVKQHVIRNGLRKVFYIDYAYAGGHIRGAIIDTALGHKLF